MFGAAASSLGESQAPSPFQRDLRSFGLLIARLTIALVLVVLTTNILFGRPVLESLMFSVALAVGLTPELLPMITTVTLSRGALRMAARKVIVKRLASIHDLGAMTILCTDKTGTLTSAKITLDKSLDASGVADDRAARLGAISAELGGDRGALDAALTASSANAAHGWAMLARHAFDFTRQLGSVLVDGPEGRMLIAKGAPEAIIPLCTAMRTAVGVSPMNTGERTAAQAQVRALAEQGLRAVAIAARPWAGHSRELEASDEAALTFEGIAAFADPPKATCAAGIARLAAAGIRVKILSGDDPVVVRRLASLVGLNFETVLSGSDIAELSDEALAVQVQTVDAYGRLAPDQKSRLIEALQSRGNVVGFLGGRHQRCAGAEGSQYRPLSRRSDWCGAGRRRHDPARTRPGGRRCQRRGRKANLRQHPEICAHGRQLQLRQHAVDGGRVLVFAVPAHATDADPAQQPSLRFFRGRHPLRHRASGRDGTPAGLEYTQQIRFAGVMGPLSSAFDMLTFAGLLLIFHAAADEFRTVWFIESMATQILVIFIIRTNGRPWSNRPHPALTMSSLLALAVAMIVPLSPIGTWFGFRAPPLEVTCSVGLIVVAYLVCAEFLKRAAVGAAVFAPHASPPTLV